MPDRANVLKGLECCTMHECGKNCPYHDIDTGCRTDMEIDALALLKEQDAHYRNLVVSWLREIALNNYTDDTEMRFVDVVEEIKDRAEYGLERYFSDSRKS